MTRALCSVLMVLAALLLVDGAQSSALAQGMPDSRVAVTLTGGYAAPSASFTQNVTFEQYSETGSLSATYSAARRPSFDGGAGVRLWNHFGIGVSGSYFRDPGSGQITASVPNPLAFSQPRQIAGTAATSHTEAAAHVQAAYWLQASRRVTLVLSGGPSMFSVTQAFVSDVTYTQDYPYTTATYEAASTVEEHKRAIGFNVGAEVGWRLAAHLDLAGLVRFSRATMDFPDASTQGAITAGGLHFGGGVRFVF
jgi:hypothetical protein